MKRPATTIHDLACARSALRADAGTLSEPTLPPPRLEGGQWIVTGRAARTHGASDPLVYPWGREMRDRREVAAIAAQLTGKPIARLHPRDTDHGGSIAAGAHADVVGKVKRSWVDGDFAMVEMAFPRELDLGMEELSLGYASVLDSGGFQRGISVDHLALVPRGRCGPSCRLRSDCGCGGTCGVSGACYTSAREAHSRLSQNVSHPPTISGANMPDTISTDETVRQLGAQLASAEQKAAAATVLANSEKLRADTAEGKIIEIEKKVAALEAQVAGAQTAVDSEALRSERARADAAEEKVRNFDATMEEAIRARVELERTAAVVLPELKMGKLTDRQIRAAVVKHCDAAADVSDGVPDGILTGRFLAITSARIAGARAQARVAEATATQARNDAKQTSEQKRRNAWRQPLPNSTLIKKGA